MEIRGSWKLLHLLFVATDGAGSRCCWGDLDSGGVAACKDAPDEQHDYGADYGADQPGSLVGPVPAKCFAEKRRQKRSSNA